MNASSRSQNDIWTMIETVLRYVDHDLNELERLTAVCYPTIMLVFSAMEFLGSFGYGFDKGSRIATSWFINEYMGRVNSRYRDPNWKNKNSFCGYLYSFVRSSLVHNASLYENIGMAASSDLSNYHLHRIETKDGTEILFVHSRVLLQEFRQAKDLFLKKKRSDPNFPAKAARKWTDYQENQETKFPAQARLVIVRKFPHVIPGRTYTATSPEAIGPISVTLPPHLLDQSPPESNS